MSSPSVLAVHLGKEWREQRRTLLVLALVLPAALAPAFVLEPTLFDDPGFALLCAGLAALGALFTIAGDLIAGERSRGGLAWLERLPGGPVHAFRAKLLLLAGATAGLAAYGLALGTAAGLVSAEGAARVGLPQLVLLFAAAAPLVAWSLAASAWVAHGALALPLALLLVGTLGLPYERLLLEHDYHPRTLELVGLSAAATLAGVLAARRAFVHGAPAAGPRARLRSAAALAAIALVGFGPAAAVTAVRRHERVAIDPSAAGFGILSVEVTGDGTVALVQACQERAEWEHAPLHVLCMDLASGAWRDLGADTHVYTLYGPRGDAAFDLARVELDVLGADGEPLLALDAADGSELDLDRDTARGGGPHEGVHGEAPELPPLDHVTTAGLGWKALGKHGHGWSCIDPFRGRLFHAADVLPEEEGFVGDPLIGPSGWLVGRVDGAEGSDGTWGIRWCLLDPDTGETRAMDWPEDGGWEAAMLADGRLLSTFEGRLALADPASGAFEPISLDGRPLRRGVRSATCAYAGRDVFRAGEPVLVTVYGEDDYDGTLYLLDPAAARAHLLGPMWRASTDPLGRALGELRGSSAQAVCAALDAHTVLVRDEEQRLVALDVTTGERRVLFPRAPQS